MIKNVFLLAIICFSLIAFSVPEKIEKKANVAISKFLGTDNFQKEMIVVSEAANKDTSTLFSEDNFFKIVSEEKHVGYGYIGNAPSKTATYDYLVLFDTNWIITKSKVLVYREEYGGEIGSKRWLRQFTGATVGGKPLRYNQEIIPISGATISVQSMTKAMNELLKDISYLTASKQI